MRICILADGESVHTVRWCRHFHDLGHEVHLISLKAAEIEGVKVYFLDSGNIKVKGGNWKVMFKYREVKKLLALIRPDVLHALYATSYGMLGALSRFHPYIITPLGSDILVSPKSSLLYRFMLKYVFKKADIITSMAAHMKDAMLSMGVPPTKMTDIAFGINTSVFNSEKRRFTPDTFTICSSRNYEPVYNIPHFLNAIAAVRERIPSLKVIMLGSGSLKDELVALTRSLKIDDIITFSGKVPEERVVEILNESHVYVSVSLSDGNSSSLIEAIACGAYPIVTDIPANREWIKDGVNGKFVDIGDVNGLADAILKAYETYDQIIDKANSENEKLIAEKGTWQVNMKKMESVYKKLSGKTD